MLHFLVLNLLTGLIGFGASAWAADPPPIAPVVPPSANPPAVLPPAPGSQTPFAASREQKPVQQIVECPAGPNQIECLRASMARDKKKSDESGVAPILNALSSAFPGGGDATYEPANPAERMAHGGGGGGSPSGGYSASGSKVLAKDLKANSSAGYAAIVPPFQKWFDTCTEKLGYGICSFRNDGIWGDAEHRKRRSCHNSGRAIDVGVPLNCSNAGVLTNSDDRTMEVAKCMATQTGNIFTVIYQDATPVKNMVEANIKGRHKDHIHINLQGGC